jgi:hypothetical protein
MRLQPGGEDSYPFRFESFEEMFSCGQADTDRAREALLKRFPIGSPIRRIRDFFHNLGGRCFTDRDWGDDLFCTYGCMLVPLFMATGRVVIIRPGEDKDTIGSMRITVGCDSA